jgi:hypothetical protein
VINGTFSRPRLSRGRSLLLLASVLAGVLAPVAGAIGDSGSWSHSTTAAIASTTTTTTTSAASGTSTGSGGGLGGAGSTQPSLAKGSALATLEQCATAVAPQTERAATFAGEMAATASSFRMEMRIDVEELAAGQTRYRTVVAPGLGVWQRSNDGVKTFTHIQQVTDLSVPALYRGAIHFRWLNAKGKVLKSEELHTASCEQPAPPEEQPVTPSTTG